MGLEEPFPLPMPNGRYRFRKRSLCCQRTGHVGFWVRFLSSKIFVMNRGAIYQVVKPQSKNYEVLTF